MQAVVRRDGYPVGALAAVLVTVAPVEAAAAANAVPVELANCPRAAAVEGCRQRAALVTRGKAIGVHPHCSVRLRVLRAAALA